MSEIAWLNFLKNTSLICNGIGVIIAVILLLGPQALKAMSNFFDKYHTSLSLERVLLTKVRISLGFVLLVITLVMFALSLKIKI